MPTKIHDDVDLFYLFNLNIILFIINILSYLRSHILLQDEYLF